MRRGPIAVLLVVSVCAVVALGADWSSRDPASVLAQADRGTAVLTGAVITGDLPPQPVRRATVRLSREGMSTRLVGTDDDGRFVFDGLPAGSYTLSATKTGYVTTYHGATTPGRGPGIPVAVNAGGRADVMLVLVRGGVITGTVTNPQGLPAAGVPVLAFVLRPLGTAPSPARAMTDDRGIYRIFGLAPGDYVVAAIPRIAVAGRGRPGDVTITTDAEVRWARAAAASGGVATFQPGSASMPPPGRIVAYAPVYYPGSTDAAAAARVSVEAGDEETGVDLSLQIVATARIAGTLVDATGQPVDSATVSLVPRSRDRQPVVDAVVSSGALALSRGTASMGGFSIPGVVPGDYTVVARSGSGQRMARPPAGSPPGPPVLWSVTDILVDGSDRTDLVLRLMPGLTLTGSIVFESPSLTPPVDLTGVDLSLAPSSSLLGAVPSPRATVNPDGTFRFSSVAPLTYFLRAGLSAAPGDARWTLKSAMVDGRDLADGPLDATNGGLLDGLVVTFTDRAAEVSGRLIDAAGRPVTLYSIVVVTTDRSLWLPGARRIRSTRPATDGTFSIAGLPAGEYAVVAVEHLEDGHLADPAFLAGLVASAYSIRLAEGEAKRQDLRVGR